MPQTIAIQRGASSVANNSFATLFTQSGGLATRVVFNMFTFYANTSGNGSNVVLVHTSAGGGSTYFGTFASPSNTASGIIMPNGSAVPGAYIGNASGVAYAQGTYRSGSTSYLGTQITAYPSTPTNSYQYVPQNFWIGPSDTLSVGVYDSGWTTVNFAWSFTTITET